MNGLELQRELAARQIKVPVIFITECGSIEVSVQAMKAGAVDFLTRSCHPSELLDAIHQAIERDRAARQERAELLELRHRFSSLTPRNSR